MMTVDSTSSSSGRSRCDGCGLFIYEIERIKSLRGSGGL